MSGSSRFQLDSPVTDIVEIAALRGRAKQLVSIAAARGVRLSEFGRAESGTGHIVLSVRPERWLLLSRPAPPGLAMQGWQSACASVAVAIDLSSALSAFQITGPAIRDVLARGCRLDLDPEVFPVGYAAATIMAQVSVILVNLESGVLLLTPSTTARHFHEWLLSAARPFE